MKWIVCSLIALACAVPCSLTGTSFEGQAQSAARGSVLNRTLRQRCWEQVARSREKAGSPLKLRGGSWQGGENRLQVLDFPSRSFQRKCYHAAIGEFYARWDPFLEHVSSSEAKCKEGMHVLLLPKEEEEHLSFETRIVGKLVKNEDGSGFKVCFHNFDGQDYVSSLQTFLGKNEAELKSQNAATSDFSELSEGNFVFFEGDAISFCILADIFRLFRVELKTSLLLCQTALKIDSMNVDALAMCGFIEHRYNSNVVKAKEYYEKALEKSPDNVDVLAKYGILLLDENLRCYGKAEQAIEKALAIAPNHTSALCGRAIFVQETCNQYDAAEKIYLEALSRDKYHADALCFYATFVGKFRKQYTVAEDLYKISLEKDPINLHAMCNYGLLFQAVFKKFDEAEMLYRRVLNISEMFSPAWSFLGLLKHSVHQDYAEAEHCYSMALKYNANFSSALCNYGHLLLSVKGDHNRAEDLYRRAYEVDPKDAINLCNYAHLVEVFRKDYERAENLYKEALCADPCNVAVLCNYGHLLARSSQDLERAEEMLKKAVRLDPSYEDAVFGLSIIRSKMNARPSKAPTSPSRNPLHEKMYQELQRRRDVRSLQADKKKEDEEQMQRADRMAEMLLKEEEADLEAKRGQGDPREGSRRGKRRF